mmetsp:Transcript_149459/g.212512  ORF Transcript_149459/g.212512 Transcript_149459/m.212512 type:complete len:200 (+) Transcript_149459:127-726(+)
MLWAASVGAVGRPSRRVRRPCVARWRRMVVRWAVRVLWSASGVRVLWPSLIGTVRRPVWPPCVVRWCRMVDGCDMTVRLGMVWAAVVASMGRSARMLRRSLRARMGRPSAMVGVCRSVMMTRGLPVAMAWSLRHISVAASGNAGGNVCLPLGHDAVDLLDIAVKLHHENGSQLLLACCHSLLKVGLGTRGLLLLNVLWL